MSDFKKLKTRASKPGCDWDTKDCADHLPIPLIEIVKLNVGDLLVVSCMNECDECVIVKSIDAGSSTICLYGRGYGSTSGSPKGIDLFTITILNKGIDCDFEKLARKVGPGLCKK